MFEWHPIKAAANLSKLFGSRYNLRELRAKPQGRTLRIFYGFDPKRRALVLVGGDKTGQGDRFYGRMLRVAEHLW